MVKFELAVSGNEKKLIMKSTGKTTSLLLNRPLTGPHAQRWPRPEGSAKVEWTRRDSNGAIYLKSPFHTKEPNDNRRYNTLGRRIINGETRWGPILNIFGRFSYIPKYWEWLEDVLGRKCDALRDARLYEAVYASLFTYEKEINILRAFCESWCSETNTLHTSAGEASISLWDLNVIGGLPIFGSLYDEVIPYPDELVVKDGASSSMMPSSCRFLFSAFHFLNKRDKVSLIDWVDFWFKGDQRYKNPTAQTLNKNARPKYHGNPSGVIKDIDGWSSSSKETFAKLGVPEHLFMEVYLAAFLSCWLCVFALPDGSNLYIRPTTFKPAASMAFGKRLSLAFPVLACIYKGLNVIANSPTPGLSKACLPVHYVLAWMGYYFNTHHLIAQPPDKMMMTKYAGQGGAKYFGDQKARDLIHSGDAIAWNATSFTNSKPQPLSPFLKENPLSVESWGRYATIRPCFLSLHCENGFILEPYNPHRFSRQFGFRQMLPSDFEGEDIRTASLEDGFKHWCSGMLDHNNSKAVVPSMVSDLMTYMTGTFKDWWNKVHGRYLFVGRDSIISSIKKVVHDSTAPKGNIVHELNTSKPLAPVANLQRTKKRLSPQIELENSLSESDRHPRRKKSKPVISGEACPQIKIGDFSKQPFFSGVDEVEDFLFNEGGLIIGEGVGNLSDFLGEEGDRVSFGSTSSVEGPHSLDLYKGGVEKPLLRVREKSKYHQVPANNPELRIDVPQKQACPPVSVFSGDDIVVSLQKKYLSSMWEELTRKFSRCPLEQLSSLEKEANIILNGMKITPVVDLSMVRKMVSELFTRACECDHHRSLSLETSLTEAQKRVIIEKEELIGVKSVAKGEHNARIVDYEKRLATIVAEIERLNAEKEEVQSALARENDVISKVQDDIDSLSSDVSTLKAQGAKNDESDSNLAILMELLAAEREELVNLRLFP